MHFDPPLRPGGAAAASYPGSALPRRLPAGAPAPEPPAEAPRVLPRPPAGSPSRRPWVVGAVLVVGFGLLGGIVGRWLTSAPPPQPSAAPTTVAGSPDSTLAPTKPPCPGSAPAVPAGAVAVVGDLAGAGCTSAVVWWPDRGEAERPEPSGARTQFVLGDPGDQLVLGDWNGDGLDTPGLYDPQRGEIVRFSGWADVGQVLTGDVDPTTVILNGLVTVVRHAGGDDIEVKPAP